MVTTDTQSDNTHSSHTHYDTDVCPTFELYDQLVSKLTESTVKSDQQFRKFIEFIKHSDQTIHNTIYALIKHHDNLSQQAIVCSVPYKAEHRINGNMKFSLEDLPPKLQQVLFTYMKLVNDTQLFPTNK